MDINSVVRRAMSDPDYAKQLSDAAAAAETAPVDSGAWEELLKHFGTTPAEFARLQCQNPACGIRTSMTALVPVTKALNVLMKAK